MLFAVGAFLFALALLGPNLRLLVIKWRDWEFRLQQETERARIEGAVVGAKGAEELPDLDSSAREEVREWRERLEALEKQTNDRLAIENREKLVSTLVTLSQKPLARSVVGPDRVVLELNNYSVNAVTRLQCRIKGPSATYCSVVPTPLALPPFNKNHRIVFPKDFREASWAKGSYEVEWISGPIFSVGLTSPDTIAIDSFEIP